MHITSLQLPLTYLPFSQVTADQNLVLSQSTRAHAYYLQTLTHSRCNIHASDFPPEPPTPYKLEQTVDAIHTHLMFSHRQEIQVSSPSKIEIPHGITSFWGQLVVSQALAAPMKCARGWDPPTASWRAWRQKL